MAGNRPIPPGWKQRDNRKLPASNFNNTGRVNLNVEDFDRLLEQKGVRVKVYRSMFCPNEKSIDGSEHELDCPLCRGSQFIDVDPICTLAFLQGQTEDTNQLPEGLHDRDTIFATFERGIELQYFTLVELQDFDDTYFQRIQRQAGQVDMLKYQAKCVNVIVGSSGKRFYQDKDFTLDVNGNVKWKANKGPQTNEIYSINYQIAKQFRAIKAQHVERYTQVRKVDQIEMVKLPEQWILEKDYLVERKNKTTGDALGENQIYDPVVDED